MWRSTVAAAPFRFAFVDFYVRQGNKTIMISEFFILTARK